MRIIIDVVYFTIMIVSLYCSRFMLQIIIHV
jgi:hypothetical protein